MKKPTTSSHKLVRRMIMPHEVQPRGKCPICDEGFETPGAAIYHAATEHKSDHAIKTWNMGIDPRPKSIIGDWKLTHNAARYRL